LTVNHKYLTTNFSRIVANLKTGLKKLNLKGCAVSTRKQFAEDANFQMG